MPAGPVVLNNTPLAALSEINQLDLLRALFGEVVIPPTVREEFLAGESYRRFSHDSRRESTAHAHTFPISASAAHGLGRIRGLVP